MKHLRHHRAYLDPVVQEEFVSQTESAAFNMAFSVTAQSTLQGIC